MIINQLTSGTGGRQRRTSSVEHRKTVLRRHGALYEAKLRVLLKWFYAHYVCVGDAAAWPIAVHSFRLCRRFSALK